MEKNIHNHRILILDFGSQYTQLLARRIREIGVYCELFSWDVTEAQIRKFNPNGIILSGGPESTTKENSPLAPQYVFQAGIPILGICYGMQVMAIQLGGYVETSKKREFGYARIEIVNENALVDGIQDSLSIDGNPLLDVWMSHCDKVTTIPSEFVTIAKTDSCPFAIISNEKKYWYGLQFHPEVTHTRQGMRILERFVRKICQCKTLWTSSNIINNTIQHIRQRVHDEKVLLALSGGVDSSVTAILLNYAIGKNLTCVFIDNGLLRLNEAEQVMNMLGNRFGLDIVHVKGEKRFLQALKGKKDPEVKRKIIGRVFVELFNEESMKLEDIKWLAQGTIYPDIIESAVSKNNKTHVIKSHHNVGGLPKKMKMRLIEPLRTLFKDEVRAIGLKLGLPAEILHRHPFPGPGLGVRVLGEVKKEFCDILRLADAIFIEELKKDDLYHKVGQAFTIFLPIRSVGVMGDNRKYDWVIALRAVQTIDFMSAEWVHLPHNLLSRVSNRIVNEIHGVSRVVYDISSKPPATIEWE